MAEPTTTEIMAFCQKHDCRALYTPPIAGLGFSGWSITCGATRAHGAGPTFEDARGRFLEDVERLASYAAADSPSSPNTTQTMRSAG